MDGVGDEFFARAALPLDKDGGSSGGDLGDEIANLSHRGRLSDETFKAMLA